MVKAPHALPVQDGLGLILVAELGSHMPRGVTKIKKLIEKKTKPLGPCGARRRDQGSFRTCHSQLSPWMVENPGQGAGLWKGRQDTDRGQKLGD